MLIGMETILEILESAICTAFVQNQIPSSVILIGPSGAGKSQALLLYDEAKIGTIHHTDDLTSKGIDDIVIADQQNKIAHLLCPDFNVVLSHKDSVVNLTSAKLMTLMSDGVCRIDDGRQVKEVRHRQMGILTAMTQKVYTRVSKRWEMLGFKRRFIPVFFDYTAKTIGEVQAGIRKGHSNIITIKKNPLPKTIKPCAVKINSKEAHSIETLSMQMASKLSYHPAREAKTGKLISVPGEDFLPFTPNHVLRAMASGHALLKNRRVVTALDVDFVANMVDFCKFGHPMMI